MVETDGPYGGGPCASSTHNHHIDVDDAIYWQTRLQVCVLCLCSLKALTPLQVQMPLVI